MLAGTFNLGRGMPSGLIQQQHGVRAGGDLRNLVEMQAHRLVLLHDGSARAAPTPRSGQTAPNR